MTAMAHSPATSCEYLPVRSNARVGCWKLFRQRRAAVDYAQRFLVGKASRIIGVIEIIGDYGQGTIARTKAAPVLLDSNQVIARDAFKGVSATLAIRLSVRGRSGFASRRGVSPASRRPLPQSPARSSWGERLSWTACAAPCRDERRRGRSCRS